MKKFLVRGLNWLGDAIMSTPALLRLRETFPGSSITVLTPKKLADLYLHHPAVDQTISFAADESVWSVGQRLKSEQFSHAIIFPNSPRSALVCWLGGIPSRIGYGRRWRNLFLTQAVADRPGAIGMHKRSPAEVNALVERGQPGSPDLPVVAHHLHHYLHLVAALGANPAPLAPVVAVTPQERERLRERWPLLGSTLPKVGLNAGAEYGPAKRWPLEHFVELTRIIEQRQPVAWVIFGGRGDQTSAGELGAAIAQLKTGSGRSAEEVLDLSGKTNLRELSAGLASCQVVVTNDTGPMHLAAAVGTAVVVPFGSTSPDLTAPGLPGDARHFLLKSKVPCAPCFLRECPIDFRCLRGMEPGPLAEAVLQRLSPSSLLV